MENKQKMDNDNPGSLSLSLSRLATVEVQLIMHSLQTLDLLSLASCGSFFRQAASRDNFAWKHVSPVKIFNKDMSMTTERIRQLGILSMQPTSPLKHIRLNIHTEHEKRHACWVDLYKTVDEFCSDRVSILDVYRPCKLNTIVHSDVAKTIASFVPRLRNLECFHLQSTHMDTGNLIMLSKAIYQHKTITSIKLSNNLIDSQTITALTESFESCPNLTSITLSGNFLYDSGILPLVPVLTRMTHVYLDSNRIGNIGMAYLSDVIKQSTSLKTIHLRWNSFSDEGVIKLADAIKNNTSLTELDMCLHHKEYDCISALADAIKYTKSLKKLIICKSGMGDKGIKILANGIKSNRTLTNIAFNLCQIEEEGAKELADAIKENSSLTSIDLESNTIKGNGASFIADALKGNVSIKHLNLAWNDIGVKGACALANVINCHITGLTSLNVCCNNLSSGGLSALGSIKENNKHITLYVGGN